MLERQGGLFKAPHSEIGKRTVLSCGFVAIVCFFCPFCLMPINSFPDFPAGAGKSVLWYAIFRQFPWSKVDVVNQLCHYQGH